MEVSHWRRMPSGLRLSSWSLAPPTKRRNAGAAAGDVRGVAAVSACEAASPMRTCSGVRVQGLGDTHQRHRVQGWELHSGCSTCGPPFTSRFHARKLRQCLIKGAQSETEGAPSHRSRRRRISGRREKTRRMLRRRSPAARSHGPVPHNVLQKLSMKPGLYLFISVIGTKSCFSACS